MYLYFLLAGSWQNNEILTFRFVKLNLKIKNIWKQCVPRELHRSCPWSSSKQWVSEGKQRCYDFFHSFFLGSHYYSSLASFVVLHVNGSCMPLFSFSFFYFIHLSLCTWTTAFVFCVRLFHSHTFPISLFLSSSTSPGWPPKHLNSWVPAYH